MATVDNHASVLQDSVNVPATFADALEYEDPVQALHLLAQASQERSKQLSDELSVKIQDISISLPDLLKPSPGHPVETAIACSDSILHSLTKIASGGSQASQEIRKLEHEKSELEAHADCIAQALSLRKQADESVQALQAQSWQATANAVRPWLEWKQRQEQRGAEDDNDTRCRRYTGDYALQQLSSSYEQLKTSVLQLYQQAVEQGDLKSLGQLTPVLSTIQLEQQAVGLYLKFLKKILQQSMQQALSGPPSQDQTGRQATPPYAAMARVYNTAVQCLRHHLPMVSHCLHRADGDAAVVQLVHVSVEEAVLPLIASYQNDRQLDTVSANAARIYAQLEERYAGRSLVDETTNEQDDHAEDCGFSIAVGSLPDVDVAMEEAALVIQHSESYLRFMQHTCREVNKARQIRFDNEQKTARLQRERESWASGKVVGDEDESGEKYKELVILDPSTQLHLSLAEVGGQYAGIERCLLLASMQRAFVASDMDPRYYRPLSTQGSSGTAASPKANGNHAMQTAMVDTCMYAARRSTQRAFATGHTGTASAMTNFCVDCLSSVLLEVLSHRAEEAGVAMLKPGEGLLVGSAGIFNASNLIRHGTTVGSAVVGHHKDEVVRKQQMREGIARACATLNDLEVAVHLTRQLEALLMETTEKGFPPGKHETEQLQMCVKTIRTVTDSFYVASNSTIESLESVLKPRIRSIVGEAVGTEGSSATGFMGSSVMGGGKAADRVMVRMDYNLDDEAYNMMQLSEGYVSRLCSQLDDLLGPLRTFLAPRLWDRLLVDVLGTVSKRLETSLRKCEFSSLGALALDSDMRDLLNFTKERLYSPEFSSNIAVTRACVHLARLIQISKLLNVDDLDDVLDLISSSKRKNNWDLKLEDAKAFLTARVEFHGAKVNELLRLPDDE